jgi:acetylcholinesterase
VVAVPPLSLYITMAVLFNIVLFALYMQGAEAVSTLTIETTSGPVTGLINGTTPNVAQFLGIPFAEPPVGNRRWLPSIAKSRVDYIDATRFGLGCPQFQGNGSSVWGTDAPQFNTPANTTGEDCLSINIWAPWQQQQHNSSELLPVIAWIYGGGFQTGAGNIEYQNPSQWIARSQGHIVVGIK